MTMPKMNPPLDARVEQSLRACHETLLKRGGLLTKELLTERYALFRERFGPERLRNLDGELLLKTMHAHGNQDSLVYWLEFKSDPEFPTRDFGSISGGSALKFGIYKSKDTGEWMTGHPKSQIVITVEQAIAQARKHRDQLIAAVAAVDDLPADADDEQYLALQKRLDQVAPDVSYLAWGHKYLSLMYPDKLDDFHAEYYQRHNLIKLLQVPPKEEGLYVCAGRFVHIAKQLGWPMSQLTSVLNERNGQPVRYWRIASKLGAEENQQDLWPDMKEGGYTAIGWAQLGDLTTALTGDDAKGKIEAMLIERYQRDSKTAARIAAEINHFAKTIEENDVVLAADGETVLGVGRVKGSYRFDPSNPAKAPHRRDVEWISVSEWNLPEPEGLQSTIWKLRKDEGNKLETERHLLEASPDTVYPPKPAPDGILLSDLDKPVRKAARLEGIPGKLQAILDRKGQAILYGPPGTGKTHWGKSTALDLAAIGAYGNLYESLTPDQKQTITGASTTSGLVRSCTFHPAYGYEDFIEGYRPQQGTGGQLVFTQRDGIFKKLCKDAAGSDRKFILLIDEINRGDIPRIFGELLTLLEKNKRGQEVILPLTGERFSVPHNVLVIGTMNTADRSIALLDTALRRRFGFVELMPDSSTLTGTIVGEAIPLGRWLDELNSRIRKHIGKDARNLQIGHAYLMDENGKAVTDFAKFSRIVAEDIIPLLEEYCYEDYAALLEILGEAMVDRDRQRVRDELFTPARRLDLIQALLAPTPDLSTSLEAVSQSVSTEEKEEESNASTK
jgi:5-methylcytosine-specific restriction enzyme B